jgi:hypothetical protein
MHRRGLVRAMGLVLGTRYGEGSCRLGERGTMRDRRFRKFQQRHPGRNGSPARTQIMIAANAMLGDMWGFALLLCRERRRRHLFICLAFVCGLGGCGSTSNYRPTVGNAVIIGGGVTAAARHFVVTIESPGERPVVPSAKGFTYGSGGCRASFTIVESGSNDSTGTCLTEARADTTPSVTCASGYLRIQALTKDDVSEVRLTLQGGSQVTSSVITVPGKYGVPVGIFFQTLAVRSPAPTTYTELDSNQKLRRAVSLPNIGRCVPRRSRRQRGFVGHDYIPYDRGPAPKSRTSTITVGG